jgi:putative transposase
MRKIVEAIKYRLYPNGVQKTLIGKHFGCCRFVYNCFLASRKKSYADFKEKNRAILEDKTIPKKDRPKTPKNNFMSDGRELTKLKKDPKFIWLNEVGAHCLTQSLKHLDRAYFGFFNKTAGFPKFHKKSSFESYPIDNLMLYVRDGRVFVPKFKEGIRIKEHRKIPKGSKILHGSISRDSIGRYFVSIAYERQIEDFSTTKPLKAIGIDLGIKDFAVCSDGERIENKKFYRNSEKKIAFLGRQISKKKMVPNKVDKDSKHKVDSCGRYRAKLKLAKVHAKIKDRRTDYLNKLSKRLTDENQIICLENLNVKGMMSNRHLSKSIGDCSFGEFANMLARKADRKGGMAVFIGRFFPSSKKCGHCGTIFKELTLKDRTWICPHCGQTMDRDLNAAKNIEKEGLRILIEDGMIVPSKDGFHHFTENVAAGTAVQSVGSCRADGGALNHEAANSSGSR